MTRRLRAVEELLASRVQRLVVHPSQPLADLLDIAGPDEAMGAVVHLIPRVFDVPLEALPALMAPARIVCAAAAGLVATGDAWLPLVDRFFDLLDHRVRARRDLALTEYPFLFHGSAWREAHHTGRASVYETLALRTHLALRGVEEALHGSPFGAARRRENLYRYALAARVFLRYLPVELVPPHEDSPRDPFPEAIVDAAFRRAGQARGAPTPEAWTPTLTDHHGRCLALFCGARPIRPRYPQAPPGAGLRPIVRGPRIRSYLDVTDDRDTVIMSDAPPEALADGESPWDYATVIERPEGGRPPWAVGRRGTPIPTLWDAGVLQPAELAAVYASLCARAPEEQPPDEVALALATLVILHTGLDPLAVLGMPADTTPEGERPALWVIPDLTTIAHELPEDLPSSPDPLPPDQYLPGGRVVELPLPPVLARLARVYDARRAAHGRQSAGRPYLRLEGPEGPRPLLLRDLERRLQAISARVTPASLRRTFAALYTWADLEPVLGAFIANRFPMSLRSTTFYTNVAAPVLAERYAQAHRRIQELILAHWPGIPPAWLTHAEPAGRAPTGRVGSWLVPRLDRVRPFFEALGARLDAWPRAPGEVGVDGGHNLYTVYVYLALLWATAMRPRRDPLVDRAALRGRGWLIVEDKHNRRYRESRPVPVADTVWPMLGALDRAGQALRRRLGPEGRLATLDAGALFFVIRRGAPRDLTPALLREVLRDEGLAYEWKLNAPRHYWISRWIERAQPVAPMEPFLGHVHDDLEPWGRYSLAELRRRGEVFRHLASTMLEEIGIRMRPHPLEAPR
jgi:hypothetical protein